MSNWIYKNKEFTITDIQNNISFVYLITNNTTNKKYIGKKTFYFSRTKLLNGKKKRIKILSDWEVYWGSNKVLQEEVINNTDDYTREILYLCSSKSEASYLETYEIFTRNALLSEEYYNEWVMCKITKLHLKSAISKINEGIKKID